MIRIFGKGWCIGMDLIEQLAGLLRSARHIVAFTGAGVSTESNIPDFRSAGGVYDSIRRKYGQPAEVLLSHSFFEAHPDVFFDYLKKYLIFPDARPNDAHLTLARLEREGKLTAVVTQNIDGLHTRAGSRKVCELHGCLARNYCVRCHRAYDLDFVCKIDGVPHCTECGGIVRPDIVLYEEALDERVVDDAVAHIAAADLMLVMGTSLAVYPAAGLLNYFRGDTLVLINRTPTPYDGRAQLIIHEAAGKTMRAAVEAAGIA